MPGSILSALPETLRLTIRCALTADAMRARRFQRSVQRMRTVMKLNAPLGSTGKAASAGRNEAPASENPELLSAERNQQRSDDIIRLANEHARPIGLGKEYEGAGLIG